MTKAIIRWPIEETTLEAIGIKNHNLPHLGRPGRFSHADAKGVITSLRPVGESRANVFWKIFSFPPHVRVSFSTSGPQFVACTNRDLGVMNFIYCPKIHISEGLRLPLPPSLTVSTLHLTPPRSCSCELCSSSVGCERAKWEARASLRFGGGALHLYL